MAARHALWLLPEEEARARLAALVEDLARLHGTPRFPPHVTLLSGVTLAVPELLARARTLAAAVRPLPVRLGGLGHTAERYRAVFVEVDGEALTAARARAEAVLEVFTAAAFRPHLSLVYGELSDPIRRAIVDGVGGRAAGPCTLDRLEVVATDGGPEEWRSLLTLPLPPLRRPPS